MSIWRRIFDKKESPKKYPNEIERIRDRLRLGMHRDELIELLGPPTATMSGADWLSKLKIVPGGSYLSREEHARWERPEGIYQLAIRDKKVIVIHSVPDVVKKPQILDCKARSIFEVTKAGDLKGIEEILEKGENVDARDNSGNTPLLVAVCFGHIKAVKLLIERGADVNAVCEGGYTPLRMAARTGGREIEGLLRRHGGVA